MPIGLEVTLSNISAFLLGVAPTISIILMVLGGIIYGLSYTQPPDSRGKWQTSGVSMIIGGIIAAAIAGAATIIQGTASNLLK